MGKIIPTIMAVTVGIILVALILVPFSDPNHSEDDEGWYYDDYRLAESLGATSVSGVFETVTIDGKDYVHATDVGTGTITTYKGTEEVTVKKATLDAVFMFGQSNAAYRNAIPSEASPIPEIGTAYYFGLEDRSGASAEENNTGMDISSCSFWSMIDDEGKCRIGDKAPSFASTYYKNTGHKVYWIDGAIGNKSVNTFVPGGFMWNYGKEFLTTAMSLVDPDKFEVSIHDYIWIQGEANSSSDIDTYKNTFLKMHGAMLGGQMGYTFEKCYISKVREVNGVNSSEAQIQLCEEYPSIIMATEISDTFTVANGLMGSDDLHYSQLGNNRLGVAIANAMSSPSEMDYQISSLLILVPMMIIIGIVVVAIRMLMSRED